MFSLTLRALTALAAAISVGIFWLNPWSPRLVSGSVPFGEVLEKLRGADSLRLQVLRNDAQAHVWVRRPGLVRWEESPERYRIAAGSRLWTIDETANSVAVSASPWFRSPENQIDLLSLLELNVSDATPLLRAQATETVAYDGAECLVYRASLTAKRREPRNPLPSGQPGLGEEQQSLEIEAFVDGQSHELKGIVARWPGKLRALQPPLAELRLVAVNEPVGDDKFVINKSLTEDGRIGRVTDAQGIVTLRPMLAKRWTPVCREMLLKPGDWLRTEIRGANAVKATLSSNVEIILGPGSLLECISPNQTRLFSGEAQVVVPKLEAVAFELLAPRAGGEKIGGGKQILRVDRNEKLVIVKQVPQWLAGFEGTSTNESLGSLIVNLPDGRNEPLTVGYHKVSVEIRDQIARTTIEESFVNHTNSRLEGTFHFPLPQDASISGFGMWIGNDLIEADIVEKQRAREIYETILRERRDPGLLEWTSGNLFKARVFPIEAQAEKRVKIVYTQVLPLRGNRYRYGYSLRSELLQTKPLRELSLVVTANSAIPLKSVSCVTHSARVQQTAHSAQVEFTAQEYTPTRNFEATFEIEGSQSNVVVVPHRRGNDGYLLVQLTPPAAEGNWQREILPDGQPVNLVLVCDTSASMDPEKRRQQAEFVASVLASLSEADRFNLAVADVGVGFAFPNPVSASPDHIAAATKLLDDRLSLGWTDLEHTFIEVLKKVPPPASSTTHVVYIGDGIVSAGETDPAAFVKPSHCWLKVARKPNITIPFTP